MMNLRYNVMDQFTLMPPSVILLPEIIRSKDIRCSSPSMPRRTCVWQLRPSELAHVAAVIEGWLRKQTANITEGPAQGRLDVFATYAIGSIAAYWLIEAF
jgi:hypothetical protein